MQPLLNDVVVATAGSGKTTKIIEEALENPQKKILVVTYTLNNVEEIRKTFYSKNFCIPSNVTILSWFSFLLAHFVRPYQNLVYDMRRVSGIAFVNGVSARFVPESAGLAHYFLAGEKIYTDKISKFGIKCNGASKGLVIGRLEKIFDCIYVDEVQDLAAYDLDILELLFRSKIETKMVGDNRQATFQTNYSPKYKNYAGVKIIDKFLAWEAKGLCKIAYSNDCHRCNQKICDFSNKIYPEYPPAVSRSKLVTGHDGVFVISSASVERYVQMYNPQVLRFDIRTPCMEYPALNFGDSKGMTFDRVLIFPNGPLKKLLKTNNFTLAAITAAKFYVGCTRARHSVCFVFDDICPIADVSPYLGRI